MNKIRNIWNRLAIAAALATTVTVANAQATGDWLTMENMAGSAEDLFGVVKGVIVAIVAFFIAVRFVKYLKKG